MSTAYPIAEYRQPLSDDERAIVSAVARGLSDVQMSTRLYMSTGAIKSHLKRIFIKLGAKNRPNMVALAYEHGILTAQPAVGAR